MAKMGKMNTTLQTPRLFLAMGLALLLAGCMLIAGQVKAQNCGMTHLASVVDGNVWQGYGEVNPAYSNGQPLASRGIVYMTDARAQVAAPADGIVEYAGPVDNMGQVVILNIGRDYRVVLAGLSQVSVETGQTIRIHDRLGHMPRAGKEPSHLYMELRCGEETVNPLQSSIAMR